MIETEDRPPTPGRALTFGLVGCGRIARRHVAQICRCGRLAATCDVIEARAAALASPYGAAHYGTIEALLAEHRPDVVAVCTPNALHPDHSIHALEAGSHVLCEKPMATTAAACRAMIEATERADRRLFVVMQNRFNPPVLAVRRLIEQGRLGRIHSVALSCFWNRGDAYYAADPWKGTAALDGGILHTQFSHFIDLLRWMIGELEEVHALGANQAHGPRIEFEDCVVVAARFRSGALGTLHFTVNAYGGNMEGSLTIVAERGTVKIGGQYLNELEYQRIEGTPVRDLRPGRPANRYGHYEGSMSNHDRVYDNVVDVLRGTDAITADGYDGLRTVETIEAIYRAVRHGA